jgi:hypothetical protein
MNGIGPRPERIIFREERGTDLIENCPIGHTSADCPFVTTIVPGRGIHYHTIINDLELNCALEITFDRLMDVRIAGDITLSRYNV